MRASTARCRSWISPLRRVGLAAEIAGAVSFLCGNDATYITGVTVNVDGGLTAMHPAL
jgi:NAD(P)-dependent dehydrogenase (short-subunit alcohol dehydrogenase family)